MRKPIQKFRQSSIVFENPSFLPGKLKTLTSSNYHKVYYFLLKLRTRFLLTNVYERVFGTFLLCLDLQLLAKIKKDLVSTRSFLTFLLITQDKKNPENPFVDIAKQETCAKFQQKIFNFVQLKLVKVFHFPDKQPGFSEIREPCLNLGIEFCIT